MINYSIIKKSQLEGALRLDAEYYQPEYLEMFNKIKKLKFDNIGNVCNVLRGNTPKEYGNYETPVVRSGDLSYEFINDEENLLKTKNDNIFFLKNNDVLISSIGFGSIGKVNIFNGSDNVFGTVSEVSVLRECKINSYFLWAFLASKFGQFQINREITGATGQLHLNTGNIENIIVPIIESGKIKELEIIYKKADEEYKNSKLFYQQAENLLLEELGLKDFETKDELFSVVKLSEIKSTNRIDAEYFQPKYEKLISKIKNKNNPKLEIFVKDYSTGFPFKSENYRKEGIPLIRINNIKKGYLDLSDTAYLSEKDHLLSSKDTARPGDIVLSMSGTIGMSAIIPDDVPKCSINQRILRITPKNIDKNYLALLLNSIIGSYQLERIGTGGVQINISYKDIREILIPILPQSTQQKIADLIQKSHESRKKAKQLLEQAKQKVERMIEK